MKGTKARKGAEFQLIWPFWGGKKLGLSIPTAEEPSAITCRARFGTSPIVKQEYFWFAYQREYDRISL